MIYHPNKELPHQINPQKNKFTACAAAGMAGESFNTSERNHAGGNPAGESRLLAEDKLHEKKPRVDCAIAIHRFSSLPPQPFTTHTKGRPSD